MAELVDAQDLKSCVLQRAYGFESHSRHNLVDPERVSFDWGESNPPVCSEFDPERTSGTSQV
jgi:hypothetical protein